MTKVIFKVELELVGNGDSVTTDDVSRVLAKAFIDAGIAEFHLKDIRRGAYVVFPEDPKAKYFVGEDILNAIVK